MSSLGAGTPSEVALSWLWENITRGAEGSQASSDLLHSPAPEGSHPAWVSVPHIQPSDPHLGSLCPCQWSLGPYPQEADKKRQVVRGAAQPWGLQGGIIREVLCAELGKVRGSLMLETKQSRGWRKPEHSWGRRSRLGRGCRELPTAAGGAAPGTRAGFADKGPVSLLTHTPAVTTLSCGGDRGRGSLGGGGEDPIRFQAVERPREASHQGGVCWGAASLWLGVAENGEKGLGAALGGQCLCTGRRRLEGGRPQGLAVVLGADLLGRRLRCWSVRP